MDAEVGSLEYSNYPDVKERIALKLALLRRWLEEGIPEGVDCPKSLAKARVWDVPEIGAFGVGSKRDWNAKNSPHRASITAIAAALTMIRKTAAQKDKVRRRSPNERIVELQIKVDALELAREAATDQWQSKSQQLLSVENQLRVSLAHNAHLKKKLESTEQENAKLKRASYQIYSN